MLYGVVVRFSEEVYSARFMHPNLEYINRFVEWVKEKEGED